MMAAGGEDRPGRGHGRQSRGERGEAHAQRR